MRRKLLFTIPNFITAGSQYVVLDILRRLDRSNFDPIVCVLKRGGIDYQVEELEVPIIERQFIIPTRPRSTLLWRTRKAASQFADLQSDIWHSWHYLDDYTEPLIAYQSGARHWIYTKKNMSWGGNSWWLRSLLARRIVAMNPLMLSSFFASPLFRYKTALVPIGIDTRRFQPLSSMATASWRTALSVPAHAVVVGCVANLVPIKDHFTLIRAIALAKSRPHLILVGRGDEAYIRQLQRLGHELDLEERIHFVGYIDNAELPQFLAELDVFALASKAEGFGAVLLEAMACEVACIATRCGGPEAIIKDGEDGFLVPVGDVHQIAVRIDTLANDVALRQQMGRDARKKVLHYFDSAKQGQLYADLYDRLAQRV